VSVPPRRAAALLAPLLLAAAASAQDGIKVVATVNGESITDTETIQRVRMTGRELTEETWAAARRELAEDILLAGEAERLGIRLDDAQVHAYWEGLLGVEPDFAASAEATGTTESRQIELARRGALAGIYMLHRVGLRGEYGDRIGPDPFLARMVVVTPRELRDLYRTQRDRFGRPAAIAFEVYRCGTRAVADAVRAGLAAGRAPTSLEPERVVCRTSELGPRAPAPALAFLRDARPGDVSPVFDAEGEGLLVATVVDRDPGRRPPPMREIQEELERMLRQQRLTAARDVLVRRLLLEAAWWPSELFDEPQTDRVAGPPAGQ